MILVRVALKIHHRLKIIKITIIGSKFQNKLISDYLMSSKNFLIQPHNPNFERKASYSSTKNINSMENWDYKSTKFKIFARKMLGLKKK